MNEYACYGKEHTIHSSGQIEWFKRGSAPLMAMPCPWCAEVASCIFPSLESPEMHTLKGTQLYILQDPMNGILLSWTLHTHLVMGSLLGPWVGLL